MTNQENSLNNMNDIDVDSKQPLSDKELASLIKASQQGSFNSVELNKKKEQSNDFKKVTLHDIAKQAREVTENYESQTKNSKEVEVKDNKKIPEESPQDKIEELESNDNKNKEKLNKDDKEELEEIIEEKKINEEEHFKKIEEEKKVAYDKGRKDALDEIKEGSDAAIAELKKITKSISNIEEFDLKNIENLISDKVLELSSDLSGKIIKALPTDFIKKIKVFLSDLENIEGNIDIFISESDHKVIESNKDIKKEISGLRLYSNKDLKHGEIELKVNGIKVTKKLST
jgi:flagellar biosynthesis/type III secretory pathway protein FliH